MQPRSLQRKRGVVAEALKRAAASGFGEKGLGKREAMGLHIDFDFEDLGKFGSSGKSRY